MFKKLVYQELGIQKKRDHKENNYEKCHLISK